MKQQSGFTLIELIAVIVILGIIAAVAVPRFVDLSGAAREAATKAVAGNLASASALNYANYISRQAGLDTNVDYVAFTECTDTAAENILDGSLPAGYAIAADADGSQGTAAGTTIDCQVTNSGETALFTGYYVPAP